MVTPIILKRTNRLQIILKEAKVQRIEYFCKKNKSRLVFRKAFMIFLKQYSRSQNLLTALAEGRSDAILYLQNKTNRFICKMIALRGLPDHLASEIQNDAMVIFIKKAREPGFSLENAKPETYYLEIAKYVIANKTRTRQYSGNEQLTEWQHLHDHSVEEYYAQKENREVVAKLLNQLGEPCSLLIRLKYLDGYSDKEQISNRLTLYGTEESLRVKRSDCMKKLREIAQSWIKSL